MAVRYKLFVHEKTGDIVRSTRQGAKKLPPEYKPIEVVKNEQGKTVMRLHLDGATVDIAETEVKKASENVNASAN